MCRPVPFFALADLYFDPSSLLRLSRDICRSREWEKGWDNWYYILLNFECVDP
jgi:hypothetical protein